MEVCENCGRSIGNLETPHVIDDAVVCVDCHGKIAASRLPSESRPEVVQATPIVDQAAAHAAAPAQQIVTNVVVNQPDRTVGGAGPAICSFLIPGLGQLVKGQPLNAVAWFLLTIIGYFMLIVPGVILHLCCIVGAAMPRRVQ